MYGKVPPEGVELRLRGPSWHTGELLLIEAITGSGFTVTITVVVALTQGPIAAVTVYVPEAAGVEGEMVGFGVEDEYEGPVHA